MSLKIKNLTASTHIILSLSPIKRPRNVQTARTLKSRSMAQEEFGNSDFSKESMSTAEPEPSVRHGNVHDKGETTKDQPGVS